MVVNPNPFRGLVLNVLIVHCHPEARSFNSSLKDAAVNLFEGLGHNVEVSDLYAENFDPVEKAQHYPYRVELERFDILSEQRNAFKTNTLPTDIQREIKRLETCDY
ncbi:NAD(P)H-dependent oxidoreductase [Gilvimarinus sp. F26214L]|uniref:NAD(P)H-dependent oxidoreductase n=1 Tax=Gilvimarinus sp. DZF01 TaxID=3461371 RepID=UPI00404666E6